MGSLQRLSSLFLVRCGPHRFVITQSDLLSLAERLLSNIPERDTYSFRSAISTGLGSPEAYKKIEPEFLERLRASLDIGVVSIPNYAFAFEAAQMHLLDYLDCYMDLFRRISFSIIPHHESGLMVCTVTRHNKQTLFQQLTKRLGTPVEDLVFLRNELMYLNGNIQSFDISVGSRQYMFTHQGVERFT